MGVLMDKERLNMSDKDEIYKKMPIGSDDGIKYFNL